MSSIIRIHPSANSTPAVVAALANAAEGTELVFEPAEYHFFSEGAYSGYFAPTNNANGEKRVVFPLLELKNVALHGNGARFIFHSRLFPFIVQGCENIALDGFSIDFSFPRYAVGEVVRSSDQGFVLKVDPEKYPFTVEKGNLAFAAGDEVRTTALKKFFLSGLPGEKCSVAYLVAGDTEDPLTNLPAPVLMTDARENRPGEIEFSYRAGSHRMDYTPGQKLLISHDENRENDLFFLENSSGILLRDISIYRGAGMGVIAQTCRDVAVENMTIGVPGWRDEPVSITADAFHFVHCDGKVTISGCTVSDTLDDAVNIHGIYTLAESVCADTVHVRLGHHEQYGFNPYRPGDVLNVIGASGCKGSAQVAGSSIPTDGEIITLRFDSDVSEIIVPGDHLENPGRMPEILIAGNSIRRCPHVLLSSSKPTVVRNNEFELAGSVTLMDHMQYWYEAGPVEDVLIESNTFYTDHAAVSALVYGADMTGRRHRNVRILDNDVIGPGSLLDASYVDGLYVRGNGGLTMNNCENVRMD